MTILSSLSGTRAALSPHRSPAKWLAGCAATAVLLLAPGTSFAQVYVHGLRDVPNGTATNSSSFGVFDLSTNTYQNIGATTVRFFDIAFDQNGTLFGIQATGATYLINPDTAATTQLAMAGAALNAAAFRPTDGTLFVVGTALGGNTTQAYNQLYTLNPFTGALNGLGQIGGYESAGDLAFDINNTMYLTTTTGDFIRVNQTNGAATLIGNTGFTNVFGLAYDREAQTMYGITNADGGRQFFTINTATGQGTALSTYSAPFNFGGGSFRNEAGSVAAPEPSALGLLLPVIGLTGCVIRRRKTSTK